MTANEVRATLPNVQVESGGVIYEGIVSGRLNQFATVTIIVKGIPARFEYAWATIASSLTSGRPLNRRFQNFNLIIRQKT
jgi:hypothetical protein